jgi:5'-methylthioadenosine phosphorylase
MNKLPHATIGIFGGSGFYELLKNVEEIEIKTPYGKPADKIAIGQISGRDIAFLPRHGKEHQYSAHCIPYKANLYAFKKLGVERILAPCAAGSLQPEIQPGDFVICDQFIDRTKHRDESYYPGPKIVHISPADPYCPELRNIAVGACKNLNIPVHKQGTVVVIEGPRFSTKAESKWYAKMDWQVINMTQYPEVVLARELEMCYVNVSLITDYDAGLEGDKNIKPVTAAEVIEIFNKNVDQVKKLIHEMAKLTPEKRSCRCGQALEGAELKS